MKEALKMNAVLNTQTQTLHLKQLFKTHTAQSLHFTHEKTITQGGDNDKP